MLAGRIVRRDDCASLDARALSRRLSRAGRRRRSRPCSVRHDDERSSAAGHARRRVARRAQGSRDRVPHAHGVSLGARLLGARDRDLLLRVGRVGRHAGRSRARRALGRAHVLGAARASALVRHRGARSRHRRAARVADQPRVDLPRQGDREPDLSRARFRSVAIPALALFYNLPLGPAAAHRVRDRAAGDDRHRRGRHAVQRDGGEHAAGRAVAADAEPSVLRAGSDERGAGGDARSRGTAGRRSRGRG